MDPPPDEFPDVLNFWTLLEGVSDGNPDVVHDDRKDCLILRFTGGTTGAPKAVMYCSRQLHGVARTCTSRRPIRSRCAAHGCCISG